MRDLTNGRPVEAEIWRIPFAEFGSFVNSFVNEVPAPLGIGKVGLAGGRWLSGFICEAYGVQDAEDITSFGGWREYLASKIN